MTTNTMVVGGNSTNLDIFGNTTFYSGAGQRANAVGIEQTLQTAAPTAFTAKLMGVQIHSSTSGAAVTHWVFRNAGATGNQDCNLTGSVTGWIQDTTHTDSVSNGALYNFAFVGTSGGPDILFAANSMVMNASTPISTSVWAALSPVSGSAESISGTSVVFLPPGGGSAVQSGGETTETAATKVTMRAAGTYKGFCVTTCSGIGATTAVARLRINGANGNQTFTLPPSATTQDTTHTDSVAAGDVVNTGYTPNSTTTNFASHGISMAGTTSAQDVMAGQTNNSSSVTTSDAFMALGGQYSQTSSEADCKIIPGYAFTASRERARIFSNSESATVSIKLRINGADGNQSASITSGTTGIVEDTTHTDSVTSAQAVNHRFAANGGSGTLVIDWLAVTVDDGSAGGASTETGVGVLTLSGFSIVAAGTSSSAPSLGGILTLAGFKIVGLGTGSGAPTGTGTLALSGFSIVAQGTRGPSSVGTLAMSGFSIVAVGIDLGTAGGGLRQFSTFG